MATIEVAGESWVHVAVETLLGVLLLLWRASFGGMASRITAVEEKVSTFETNCSAHRVENEKHFASAEDLNALKTHIDDRFTEQRDFLIALINGRPVK